MQHRSLLGHVARFTEGMTERPAEIEETGSPRSYRDFPHERQPDRCHTNGFDLPSEQSHGPRANRSSGYQQRQIDVCRVDATRHILHGREQLLGAAHEAQTIVLLGQAPDHVLGLELT